MICFGLTVRSMGTLGSNFPDIWVGATVCDRKVDRSPVVNPVERAGSLRMD